MARLVAVLLFTLALAAPAQARDHDKLPDRWERKHHLDTRKNDAKRDRDRDGLSNYREYRAHTNPRKKDSDRDGLRDGAERRFGFKPRDRDSDDDGIKDGRENAGKVKRLAAGSITLKLAAGGRLTARLACGEGSPEDPADDNPSEDPADDRSDDTGDDPSEDAPGDDPSGEDDPEADDSADDDPEADDSAADDVADAARGVLGFVSQDDPSEDDPALDADDEAAFDRQFDEEFAAEQDDCASVRKGALVHEAMVERTGDGPVIVALELVHR
jgi:hypothetical protein